MFPVGHSMRMSLTKCFVMLKKITLLTKIAKFRKRHSREIPLVYYYSVFVK